MNVAVLGGGGREHALCHALSHSPLLHELYAIPGNAGMAGLATLVPIDPLDLEALSRCCQDLAIDLVIPGSEVYLAHGVADHLTALGIAVFGPTASASRIETSKRFAKDVMERHGIPTARHWVVTTVEEAMTLIPDATGLPVVIKYDGLAAGKGVVIATTIDEARTTLADMLRHEVFGSAPVVLEECLEGPEFSLIGLVHQGMVLPLPIAQDHKRLMDGDKGPNTGGMGVYSPVPIVPDGVVQDAIDTILQPMADAMMMEGLPYTGFLYAGLMWTKEGPKVIEFNARLGDPEAEVILPRLDGDLLHVILDLMAGQRPVLHHTTDAIVGVVMASRGYPVQYQTGVPIHGLEQVPDLVYHMGTRRQHDQWLTAGGRVLLVTGRGTTLAEAVRNAYKNVELIQCDALVYRKDIAHQSL